MKSLYTQRQERLRTILREARLAAGLTQQDVCKLLKRNRNFVSAVEIGSRLLDVAEFVEYCEALAVDPRKAMSKLLR